jgi:hypothetical protein
MADDLRLADDLRPADDLVGRVRRVADPNPPKRKSVTHIDIRDGIGSDA